MEPAKIDWESIDSVVVIDDLYEDIKAPKWVDFSAPPDALAVRDDETWFCRPDCNHPKTVEDLLLLKVAPKIQRSTSLSEILPMGDRNRRDANLKRRPGFAQPLLLSKKGTKSDKLVTEDSENVNPNLQSTPSHQYNHMKSVIESSTDKKNKSNKKENIKSPQQQKLKSTLSARNLFGGRDIVNQISEFCNELKRLATRTKEREALLEKEREKCGGELEKNNVTEEDEIEVENKKKVKEAENKPPISIDLNKIKKNNKDNIAAAEITTRPPSPQCFSAGRHPAATRTPPLRPARSRLQVRGILQELDQKKKESSKSREQRSAESNPSSPVVLERESPTTLDVFWFLKPCTNLSS